MHAHSGRGGNEAVGKAHAPGEFCRDAVVAIAGGETAEAAYPVANRRCSGREIEHSEASNAIATSLPDKGEDAGDKAAEPGKSGAIEERCEGMLHQRLRVFKHMPEFGADDAGHGGYCNDSDGIGVYPPAAKILMKDPSGADSGQPEHNAEGADVATDGNGPSEEMEGEQDRDMNVRIHAEATASSIASTKGFGDILEPVNHADIHKDFPVLFSDQQIAERTAEIGRQIDQDYAGKSVVLVGVLKGAAIFLADLSRCITIDCTFDFVAVSSYGKGQRTSGAVKMIKDLDQPIENKHIIIVEDILDTGLTLCFLRSLFEQHKPASMRIAALLDKPSRRLEKIEADYVGFKIPNHFVIGYGMDYAERFRNVPDIRLMPPDYPELH